MVHQNLSIPALSLSIIALGVLATATAETNQDFSILPSSTLHHDHKQYHASHQPILSGSHFPEPKVTASADHQVHKEACPRGCVDHGDGLYLAVTSIGDGFARVQYTCSHPSHAQPTHDCSDHSHKHKDGDCQGGIHDKCPSHLEPDHAHSPADPRPEQTPLVAHSFHHTGSDHHQFSEHVGRAQGYGHEQRDFIDCSDSTAYSDLHITACNNYPRSHLGHGSVSESSLHPSEGHHSLKHGNGAQKLHFSNPHEQVLEPGSKLHTTTMTYSQDDHPHVRSIPLTDGSIVHSTSLIGHHRHHPHLHHAERDNLESMPNIIDDLTTPEPIVSIAAPTPNSDSDDGSHHQQNYFYQDAGQDLQHKVAYRVGYQRKEEKAGPPAPTPEPFPAEATHYPGGSEDKQGHRHLAKGEEEEGRNTKISHQTVRHHEQELKPRQQGEDPRFQTVIHRVTTLIIETETIVAHPAPTRTNSHTENHHSQHGHEDSQGKDFHLGDHIIFDAGEEGDMIVSIASQEQGDYHHEHQKKKKNVIKSSKTKDEL